jgi:IclR family pca regulon transcriptional regulator
VDTAVRTLDLLAVIADEDGPVTMSKIVSELGWTKPAVYRLLRTLESVGALRRVDGKQYVLGPRLITIGQAAVRATGLVDVAQPYMTSVHDATGETVVLTTLDGIEVVIIDRIETVQRLIPRYHLGERLPAYCTSTGQVALSDFSDDEVRTMLAGCKFEERGPRTLKTIDEVIDRLERVRRRGYALNDEELTAGHRSIAAPVRGHTMAVVGAVSVSVPTVRISAKELSAIAIETLIPATDAISADLGAFRHRFGENPAIPAGTPRQPG